MPVHEDARDGPHHGVVPVAESSQQEFDKADVIDRSERTLTGSASAADGGGLTGRLRALRPAGRRGEVEVEEGVEGELVIVALDQCRAQRGFHAVALGERQVLQALDSIDLLGERDRDADLAQLGDHAFQGREHRLPVTFRTHKHLTLIT
jgi:hypothetical protein